jgi:hypothetical protein
MEMQSIKQLSKALSDKQLSAVELTKHYLSSIEAHNDQLKAFISVDQDRAIRQAIQADNMLNNGTAQALTGIPIAHKDIFCTKDLATTCGSRMLANFVPPYDATVVRKLDAVGAITLGKTNLDEFAMGSSNENSSFGAAKKPLGHKLCARWIIRWISGRGSSRFVRRCDRNRYGRINPATRRILRHHRHQANVWPCVSSRYDRLCLFFRSGRCDGAFG